ncbi:MAG: hypothetical protein HY897_14855 [Deltaproteobacteria bacterium]|nr:hypothetical protein [Deltaproteobacteria bacterium]
MTIRGFFRGEGSSTDKSSPLSLFPDLTQEKRSIDGAPRRGGVTRRNVLTKEKAVKKKSAKLFKKTPETPVVKEAIIKIGDTAKDAKRLLSHCK